MTYSYPMGKVSAAYNSESGWSVGGSSRISRSTKWGVPSYTNDEIFTLDGRELVKASVTPGTPMCDDGTSWLYHPENENYQRILYCKPGETDSYWKIYDQAGGVSYTRLQIVGRGESEPKASNLTPEGRQQNRRVEIVVIPHAAG